MRRETPPTRVGTKTRARLVNRTASDVARSAHLDVMTVLRETKPHFREDVEVMNFADAAEKVLKENGAPLSASDITTRALRQGLIHPRSDDPAAFVRAAIRKDNKRREARGEAPRFRRTESGDYMSA